MWDQSDEAWGEMEIIEAISHELDCGYACMTASALLLSHKFYKSEMSTE